MLFLPFSLFHCGLGHQLRGKSTKFWCRWKLHSSTTIFVYMAWTCPAWIRKMLQIDVMLKIISCNMHVAKYILYDVGRKIDSFNMPRKVDVVLRKKSLLQVVLYNTALSSVWFFEPIDLSSIDTNWLATKCLLQASPSPSNNNRNMCKGSHTCQKHVGLQALCCHCSE